MSNQYDDFNEKYREIKENKENSQIAGENPWSLVSLIVSIFSICCCPFSALAIALGILAIIFSGISKRRSGKFDGLATAGMIVGIFGVVLGLLAIAATVIFIVIFANIF